jgi:hypothetical protein
MEGYSDFMIRYSIFSQDSIWIIAMDKNNIKAYRWSYKYSYHQMMACLVFSKILGIGTAERNWKQVRPISLNNASIQPLTGLG